MYLTFQQNQFFIFSPQTDNKLQMWFTSKQAKSFISSVIEYIIRTFYEILYKLNNDKSSSRLLSVRDLDSFLQHTCSISNCTFYFLTRMLVKSFKHYIVFHTCSLPWNVSIMYINHPIKIFFIFFTPKVAKSFECD